MLGASELNFNGAFYQYFATFTVNLISLSHGNILGWASPALPKLASNSTPLISGPLTYEQISWVGSINCIGALFGSLSFGYVIALIGTKRALLCLAAPNVTFWLLIYFGRLYYHILIARFISGSTGGALQTAVILYVSEIANDDIRGRLGSITLFMRNVGTLIGYILGASVGYQLNPCISIIIPVLFVAAFILIPNTPQFYLRNGQTQKAEEALKFYKGYKGNCQQEDVYIYKELDRLKAIACEQKKDEKFHLDDFFNRTAMKGLGIGIALTTFVQFTASFTISTYAVTTFAMVGTTVDPYMSSIMLAVALIFGSLTSTYLADKLGRRMLNLISLSGCAFGLLATASYHYFNLIGYNLSAFAWIPVVCLSAVIFLSSAGIAPLSILCSVEYLPSKIRTYGMTVIGFTFSLVAFISVKIYPLLLVSLDLHGCLLIYGIGCIIGFIFVLFVLKETTGTSLDDIGVNKN